MCAKGRTARRRAAIATPRAIVIASAFASLACRPPAPDTHDTHDARAHGTASASASAVIPVVAAREPAPSATRALPDVPTDWCGGDWRGLDPGACYLLPGAEPGTAIPARLLIYLPGIIPPVASSAQKTKVQRIVAAAARRAGAVALLPRGRRGIGPADAKDWWAWPTSPADVATYGAALVAEWRAARATLEAALGRPFDHVYLAGSSSGAYFLAALALAPAPSPARATGDLDPRVDGYAATSGGAVSAASPSAHAEAKKRPFYVGYATEDPTSGGPRALAAFLSAGGWPVRAVEHPGAHGAREEYLDEAFAFWSTFEQAPRPAR